MMTYGTLEEYLKDHKADRAPAILPVPTVADYLEITTTATRNRIKAETLDGVVIGDSTYVTVRSLSDEADRINSDKKIIAKMLLDAAERDDVVYYGTLLKSINRTHSNAGDRNYIGRLLGILSRESAEQIECLLSVFAVSKTTGKPNEGFWNLVAELNDEFDWKLDLTEQETLITELREEVSNDSTILALRNYFQAI